MAMIRGPIAWAKLGKPQPGYTKSQLEWSFDLGVDDTAKKVLQSLDVGDYIKPKVNPKNGKEHTLGLDYVKFSRKEIRADGSKANPIRVVDAKGEDWPEGKAIGNGSIVNVKFAVNEKATGGMKPSVIALQVWKLEEYEGADEFPTREEGSEENW